MIESERDHETVVQVLAAFVRERATMEASTGSSLWIDPPRRTRNAQSNRRRSPTADIQTALTVLGRRPSRQERQSLDLTSTDLRGADLEGANLAGAYLSDAHLEESYLAKADLEGAMLLGAHLKGVALLKANLKSANLGGAYLEGAELGKARLVEAHLHWSKLKRSRSAIMATRRGVHVPRVVPPGRGRWRVRVHRRHA